MTDTTAGNDRISIAPPPRRQLPDISGFTEMPEPDLSSTPSIPKEMISPPTDSTPTESSTDPKPAQTKKRDAASNSTRTNDKSDAIKAKKTTLHLPPTLVRQLKEWKQLQGRTTADAVMSAFIGCKDEVASQFEMTKEDKLRATYGLAPLATTRPAASEANKDGTRVVGMYIVTHALEDLDNASTDLGLSRSRYVTALLAKFFPQNKDS